MKHVVLVAIFFSLSVSSAFTQGPPALSKIEPLIDIISISGKPKKAINESLGNPTNCDNTKYGEKCSYSDGQTEIVFINGKADWITINNMGDAPYSKAALGYLGLEEKQPDFSNANVMRWSNIQGLREVSIFPSGSSVFYVYIKTQTK